jgi:drug/metabolite transporter (DMT)-like permease
MYLSLVVLLGVTALYAGYNLLVKVSSGYVPAAATTPILATMSLQAAALAVSVAFAAGLALQGGHVLAVSRAAVVWAVAAGLCIGAAEIGYFYLFRGVGGGEPMAANVAIPVIVSGAIVLTVVVSWLLFREPFTWTRLLGAALVASGVVVLFTDSARTATGP